VLLLLLTQLHRLTTKSRAGIYQPETFKRESKYGLTVLTSTDVGLIKYLQQVVTQVEAWLLRGDVQRLVVVVSGIDSGETLERWQFNVTVDDTEADGENQVPNSSNAPKKKTVKEIHSEIQAIIRQITASVTFLPLLSEPCSFDLLVYTKKDATVPKKWEDSDPCYIMNSQEVKLRSFTTSVREIAAMQIPTLHFSNLTRFGRSQSLNRCTK
jgi:mitotic spindle assembly checkpoint protein MAD2